MIWLIDGHGAMLILNVLFVGFGALVWVDTLRRTRAVEIKFAGFVERYRGQLEQLQQRENTLNNHVGLLTRRATGIVADEMAETAKRIEAKLTIPEQDATVVRKRRKDDGRDRDPEK